MTQLLEPKEVREDNQDLYKSSRLIFLLFYPGNAEQRKAAYIRQFPLLHRTLVWKDLKFFYPALRDLIESQYPALLRLARQVIRPSDMKKFPVTSMKEAQLSHISVDLIINHDQDTITWFPFSQKVYDASGKLIATVQYDEGVANRETGI